MPTPTHMNHHEQSEALKKLLAEQKPTPRWLSRLRRWWRGLFIAAAVVLAVPAEAAPSERLIDALVQVESNGNPRAVGDNGKALGCLQIWQCVIDDVNQVSRVKYTHADAFDPAKARAICRAYLAHYGTAKRLGRQPTDEDFARIWNGGPAGWKKQSTKSYWKKVAAVLK